MTKEVFILNAFRLLLNNPSVSLDQMNAANYDISRATAWRVLDTLRKADLIFLSGQWCITEEGRKWFCQSCEHRARSMKTSQQRHMEVTKLLEHRARQPLGFKRKT